MVDGEPKNAASEWWRAANRFLERDSPADNVRSALANDFQFEDRCRGSIYPTLYADDYQSFIAASWEFGAGQPRTTTREVLAVRGERLAALTTHHDYGNGMVRENITVVGLDPGLRLLHRVIDFDTDDLDAAIAELDRLHSESG